MNNPDDDDEPLPPRRRDRYRDERDDYDDDFARRRRGPNPRERVKAPGMGLLVMGWIGLVGGVLLAGGGGYFALENWGLPGAQAEEIVFLGMLYGMSGALSVVICIPMIIGAHRMRDLSSHGWAMTSAILCIVAVLTCGFIPLAFGVWAIVVLCDAKVKKEFQRSRTNAPAAEDWEDR